MRFLFLITCLAMMLSLGFSAPLAAREKGGKSGKSQVKEHKPSGKPKQHARDKGGSAKEQARRSDDRQDGDHHRHDGDGDRPDGDADGRGDRDGNRDRDDAHRNWHEAHDAWHDTNDDFHRDGRNPNQDWRHDGRHDNGWHKGWYKHDKYPSEGWADSHHRDGDWRDGDRDRHDVRDDRHRDWYDSQRDRDWNSGRGWQSGLSREQQLLNAQRNRDWQITQAQQLRQIAERNGNANLADHANWMEDQARKLYDRRVANLSDVGVTGAVVPLPPPPAPAATSWLWNWWPFR